jgi:manganese-dependent ADP-ribose/CDP-alcohol diphosphatase
MTSTSQSRREVAPPYASVGLTRRRFIGRAVGAVASVPFIARGAAAAGFEIGLVADAQYADIEPKGTRFYRKSVARLGEAVEHFNGRELAFCVHLGDLIDREWKSFDEIGKPLASSRHRWHQLLGNHDFDVLDEHKANVPKRLGMAWRYGSFDHGEFRLAILDTNDVSTYAHAVGTPERAQAETELARVKAARLPQAQPWNGGIGAAQLAWFDGMCRDARAAGRRVVVLAHHPLLPMEQHVIWNATEMLAMIDRHPNVIAWINGHNHAGAFAERNQVPFVTMRGMVETVATTAFATARILSDRMVIQGHGREPSRELVFRK